ncbi:MAG TPA: hypothetical protein VMW66_06185 [Elusimicrobiales bacterium]|nr:hypothetical protein [Elusimicrobiales bacterium]
MFNFNTWNTIGGHCRAGSAMQVFAYKTNDSLTDIFTDGYFNDLRGKVRKADLMFVHREDVDGQNPTDLIIRISLAPIEGNIKISNAVSDDWSDDGTSLKPLIDGRHVDTGSGNLITNEGTFKSIDASKIVHTDAEKKLVSIDINSAYNKNFSNAIPAVDTAIGDAGDATTVSRANHAHPKTLATTLVKGQIELATNAETQAGTDAERAITPLALSSRSTTTTRTGIAELATQAEAEAGADNERITTPLGVKQFAEANLGLKRVETQNNVGDPNNDIDFKIGRMWNHDRTKIIDFPTLLTKYGDTTFAEGTNQGGLADGVSWGANTWRHKFIIMKADGTKDAFIDDNKDATHIPAGFIYWRYVGSSERDVSANIKPFLQIGKLIIWKNFVIDFNAAVSNTARTIATLSTPPDCKTIVQLFGYILNTIGDATLFTAIAQPDVACDPVNGIHNESSIASENRGLNLRVPVDINSQIGIRAFGAGQTAKIGVFLYKNFLGEVE